MKNIISKNALISLLLLTFSAQAGLYKGLDAEGNVSYSDKPFENAEAITPPPISVVDAPKIKPKADKAETKDETAEEETKYTGFSITSPSNDQTIWNENQLAVMLQIKPELNLSQGHTTWLIMDGKARVKNNQNSSLMIGRADRGSHSLQAQIRNKKGKIIKRSQTIQVHIKQTVVPRKAPR